MSGKISPSLLPGERAFSPPPELVSGILSEIRPFVRQSGVDDRPPWHIGARKLLDFLLVCIPKGNGIFHVGDESFPVGDGDVVWIPPDTIHEMRGTSKKMRCHYMHFDLIYDPKRSHWDACIPAGTLDLVPYKRFMHPHVKNPFLKSLRGKVNVANFAFFASTMEHIHQERRLSNSVSSLKVAGMFFELVEELIRANVSESQAFFPMERRMRDVMAYIKDHVAETFDMDALSKHFSISPAHLRRLFRDVYDESPRDAYCRERILRASESLVYTDKSISQIADELGYSCVHNFSRAFKEATGVSPKRYRCPADTGAL